MVMAIKTLINKFIAGAIVPCYINKKYSPFETRGRGDRIKYNVKRGKYRKLDKSIFFVFGNFSSYFLIENLLT